MKKVLILLMLGILFYQCSPSNKKITKDLKPKQITKLIKKDTLYRDIIEGREVLKKYLKENKVTQAEVLDIGITYKDLYEIAVFRRDSTEALKEQGLKNYDYYKQTFIAKQRLLYEPVFDEYLSRIQNNNPAEYFDVSDPLFVKDWGYTILWGAKQVYLKITPKVDTLKGGVFKFTIFDDALSYDIDWVSLKSVRKYSQIYNFNRVITKPTYVLFPVTDSYSFNRFFTKENEKYAYTARRLANNYTKKGAGIDDKIEAQILKVTTPTTEVDIRPILEEIDDSWQSYLKDGVFTDEEVLVASDNEIEQLEEYALNYVEDKVRDFNPELFDFQERLAENLIGNVLLDAFTDL